MIFGKGRTFALYIFLALNLIVQWSKHDVWHRLRWERQEWILYSSVLTCGSSWYRVAWPWMVLWYFSTVLDFKEEVGYTCRVQSVKFNKISAFFFYTLMPWRSRPSDQLAWSDSTWALKSPCTNRFTFDWTVSMNYSIFS